MISSFFCFWTWRITLENWWEWSLLQSDDLDKKRVKVMQLCCDAMAWLGMCFFFLGSSLESSMCVFISSLSMEILWFCCHLSLLWPDCPWVVTMKKTISPSCFRMQDKDTIILLHGLGTCFCSLGGLVCKSVRPSWVTMKHQPSLFVSVHRMMRS